MALTLRLVAGLGNPGENYQRTRHNIGFRVLDLLAEKFGIRLAPDKFQGISGRGKAGGHNVIFVKPQTYMNRSGLCIAGIAGFYKIPSEDVMVIHDDIDLAYGKIKIKEKGGHGGNNGIRSIIEALGTDRFVRIRLGVGRGGNEPGRDGRVTKHVLGRFTPEEQEKVDQLLELALDAACTVLADGIKQGMNRFNNLTV